ncbi:MAG: RidA family protein [Actinomycetota bacterium]|nr:RidA family protein [Actinomycetota bacterium]
MTITPVRGLGSPVGLYSHAVPVPHGKQLLCVSGQLSVDAAGGSVAAGDFDAQMRQVFSNLSTVLAVAGGSLADLVKMTTYLVDPDHIDDFYRVREDLFAEYFPDAVYPGNTLLVIGRLVRPEFLIEIEALAAIEPITTVEVAS